MAVELQNVCKAFGEKQVLQDFSHTFPEGELTCVMGPSGCGKTTLLSLLLGLEQPDAGEILGMDGIRIIGCGRVIRAISAYFVSMLMPRMVRRIILLKTSLIIPNM